MGKYVVRTAFGHESYMPKTLLIIGNGFDMSLGLKTSYMEFAESKYWPFDDYIYNIDNSLSKFLNQKRKLKLWFDLEKALAEYTETDHEPLERTGDQANFTLLVKRLQEYLANEQNSFEPDDRCEVAKKILELITEKEDYHIHSFNYTNLPELAQRIGVKEEIPKERMHYVHGSLANNDIILGTGDTMEMPDDYAWLYKSFNEHYRSNDLAKDLADADEVYIFGHSLGDNDFDYFSSFFQSAIHERTGTNIPDEYKKIKIRIITKDSNSEYEIKKKLRILTDKHVQGLYAFCDFRFYQTERFNDWKDDEDL